MNSLAREGALGSILLKSQIITEDDIRLALVEQQVSGCRFGEALLKLGIVTQEDIDWALSSQLNIPYVRLKKEMMDPSVVELVPAGVARRFSLVPLIRVGGELSIAIADPLDKEAIDELMRLTGCQISVSVALLSEIHNMLDLLYGVAEDTDTLGFSSGLFSTEELDSVNKDLTGGRLLDLLLSHILQGGLSSLALQPVGDVVGITGRRGDILLPVGMLASAHYPGLLQRIRMLSRIDGAMEPSASGVLSFHFRGEELLFQVGLLRGNGGDYVTLKLRIASAFPVAWADLGVSRGQEDAMRSLCGLKSGLVLVTAQNADERHRLLDLFLEEIPTEQRTVLLLGDGLGHGTKRFPRISLPPRHAGAAQGLIAAALEHDPDVLVVEDVMDSGAMTEAVKAAMRGRLVLAGLDLHDTTGLIRFLFTLWRRNHFIPTSLKGLVVCKGVLTLCPACRQSYEPEPGELEALRLPATLETCYRSTGCPECGQTGFAGRKYLLDIIPFSRDLQKVFESAGDADDVLHYLADNGCRGIGSEGLELLRQGEISPAEFVASVMM